MTARLIPFPATTPVSLSETERDAILLGADELVARGGPELLSQVLKGLHSELVLLHKAERLKHFGALRRLTLGEIEARIQRLVDEDLLRIEHYGERALVTHSPAGWERVKPLSASNLYDALRRRAEAGRTDDVYQDVGRSHREVKHLLLERIARSGSTRFVPVLNAWSEREGKGMKRRITEVIRLLDAGPSQSRS